MEVTLAALEDFEAIWELIHECGDSSNRLIGKQDLKCAAFSEDDQQFKYIAAKCKGRIVGVVSVFYLYSTWEGRFLFIDEFLVHPEYSELDVDVILLKTTFKYAIEKGCCRVQFNLYRSDTSLQEKYIQLGGVAYPEWLTVRLSGVPLNALANQSIELPRKYSIRSPVEQDAPSILYLIQCLAEYENEPHAVRIDAKTLSKDGFSKPIYYQCFVAETTDVSQEESKGDTISGKMPHNPQIIGMALYLTIYCKRKGKVLHLEDLFVKEGHRNQGVGTALLRECAKVCVSSACNEMDWQVLDWNKKAIDLYERLGGVILQDLLFVRYTRDIFANIVAANGQ